MRKIFTVYLKKIKGEKTSFQKEDKGQKQGKEGRTGKGDTRRSREEPRRHPFLHRRDRERTKDVG